jgi:hypothetical protein
MPGIEYMGQAHGGHFPTPAERGNILGGGSHAGAAMWIGSEIAAWGEKKWAFRNLAKAGELSREAKDLRKGAHKMGSVKKGLAALKQAGEFEAEAGHFGEHRGKGKLRGLPGGYKGVQAGEGGLRGRALLGLKQSKSLMRLGRYGFGLATTLTFGYELGSSIMSASSDSRIRRLDLQKSQRKIYDEDKFMDSRAAFTQRQRAIQVIHNSQMGVRSAMGSEASYLHY